MTHRGVTAGSDEGLRGHRLYSTLDLREDRHAATTIQVAFVGTVVAMVVVAFALDLPLDSSLSGGVTAVVTVVACVAYMALHELTHALLLWVLTRERPSVAVRLPYLVTGSRALLTRRTAVAVAVAPVVLFTVVLLGLLASLPTSLFLTAYVVLGLNLASSAGDVLQAWGFLRLPAAALVCDDGETTSVYLPVASSDPLERGRTSTNDPRDGRQS